MENLKNGTVFIYKNAICIVDSISEYAKDGPVVYAINKNKDTRYFDIKLSTLKKRKIEIVYEPRMEFREEILRRLQIRYRDAYTNLLYEMLNIKGILVNVLLTDEREKLGKFVDTDTEFKKLVYVFEHFFHKKVGYVQNELLVDYAMSELDIMLPDANDLIEKFYLKFYSPKKSLKEELNILSNSFTVYDNYNDKFKPGNKDWVHSQIVALKLKDEGIAKIHNSIEMDFENTGWLYFTEEGKKRKGFHTVRVDEDEIEFFAMYGSGDGGLMVTIIFYVLDGKFYGYVPDSKYNLYNRDTMAAIGLNDWGQKEGEDSEDTKYIKSLGIDGIETVDDYWEHTKTWDDSIVDKDMMESIVKHFIKLKNEK